MNVEQLLSFLRQILIFAGGFIVAKGWIDNETMIQIVGAVIAVITSYFAFKTRTTKNIVASAAAKVPVSDTAQKSVGITEPVKPA